MDRILLNEATNPATIEARTATLSAFPSMDFGPGASAESNLDLGLRPVQP